MVSQASDSQIGEYGHSSNLIKGYEDALNKMEFYRQQYKLDSALIFGEIALQNVDGDHKKETISRIAGMMGDIHFEELNFEIADSLYNIAINSTSVDLIKIKFYLRKGSLLIRQEKPYILNGILEPLELLIDENTPDDLLFTFYTQYAEYYKYKDEFINELDYWLKAKNLINPEQCDMLEFINHSISIIYFRFQDYESSLDIFKENLELAEERNDDFRILFSYYGIADCYLQLNELANVKTICNKAIKLKENTCESSAFGFIYHLLGSVYLKEGTLDSAQYYINKGIEISTVQNERKELADNYITMVNLLLSQGDTLGAQFYAEKAIELRAYHDSVLKSHLAEIYESQNKYFEANLLLRENLNLADKKSDKNAVFNLASSLLKNKFEKETEAQLAIDRQEFQKRQLKIVLIAATALLILFSIIIIGQITHRKKIQKINAKLLEKNENLNHFAYICSHDLKEPLRNVGSFAGLIKHKLEKEDLKFDYSEYFQIINTGVLTLAKTVDSLKTFIEINEGRKIEKTKFSLDITLNSIKQNLFQLIGEKGAIVSVNNSIEQSEIYSSENDLLLVLQNVIRNSIQHNDTQHPKVDVNITKRNQDVLISVRDNGPGISENYFEQIFKPFKTLKNKSISNSAGLGLAITKKIINIIGGKIWIESEEGKGSTFHILLPQ